MRKYIKKNIKSFIYSVLYTVLGILVSLGAFGLIVYSAIAWEEEMKGLLLILVGLFLLIIGMTICVFSINHISTISLYIEEDKEVEEIFSIEDKGNSISENDNKNIFKKRVFKRRVEKWVNTPQEAWFRLV